MAELDPQLLKEAIIVFPGGAVSLSAEMKPETVNPAKRNVHSCITVIEAIARGDKWTRTPNIKVYPARTKSTNKHGLFEINDSETSLAQYAALCAQHGIYVAQKSEENLEAKSKSTDATSR